MRVVQGKRGRGSHRSWIFDGLFELTVFACNISSNVCEIEINGPFGDKLTIEKYSAADSYSCA